MKTSRYCFAMICGIRTSLALQVVIEATAGVIEAMGDALAVTVSSRLAPASLAVKPHHGCVVHPFWESSLFA